MQHHPSAFVPLPELAIDAAGTVRSTGFDDIYFAPEQGAAETRHVFLGGNGLPARWQAQSQFIIAELGFGTGQNFLTTWQDFLRSTPPTHHLHYISVEQFPLTAQQMQHLWGTAFPAFCASYPLRLPGWHRVVLERCTLTLGIGDAAHLLADAKVAADAWYLDGFAPAKNDRMWSESLMAEVARLTAPGGTVATFTAAGAVKRGLAAAGFAVDKVAGFGRKRDMLVGRLAGAAHDGGASPPSGNPAIKPCVALGASREAAGVSAQREGGASPPSTKNLLIIGAGIAGATLARQLAESGGEVTVLEAGDVAGNASGNPAAVLYPQFSRYYMDAAAWHFTGYSWMRRCVRRWQEHGLLFGEAQIGMLRLPRDQQPPVARLADFGIDPAIARAVGPDEASMLAGMPIAHEAIWLPSGGWIVPGELCAALLRHPKIVLHTHRKVHALRRDGQAWIASTADGEFRATHVCLAAAQESLALLPGHRLPMGMSAGQVTTLPASAAGSPLRCIISHQGYIVPQGERYVIGATYDRADWSGAVTAANHRTNLAHAEAALPGWLGDVPLAQCTGRTSLRASTPDRLPYVGAVDDGLYVSIGHGSRGMISAPLAAEVIASQILGTMVPLSRRLQRAVDPLRRAGG